MKVISNLNNLNVDTTKKIYRCAVCDSLFNWGIGTMWFGSYKQLENTPEKIKYICSSQCKEKYESRINNL